MKVIATKSFIRSAKPIAKKYRSFNADYQNLVDELSRNPDMGIDLGGGFRKVRMAISSKSKGKSGGSRVITLSMLEKNDCLYLIYAYDKSDYDNVEMTVIKKIADEGITDTMS